MLLLSATGVVLVITEIVIRRRNNLELDLHETKVSIVVGATWFGMKAVGGYAGLIVIYAEIAERWSLWHLPLDNPLTWLAYWLIGDFAYYWVHRAEHEIPVLWASHLVHHSSTDFGFTTAIRMPPTEIFYKPITGLWAPLLGFPPAMYGPMSAWGLITGQLQHTRLIGKLGVLDRWFTTPSNHRVHHGSNERYLDRNYGGQTMIWDRLFGTYTAETEAVVYGITTPLPDQGIWTTIKGGYPELIDEWRGRRALGVRPVPAGAVLVGPVPAGPLPSNERSVLDVDDDLADARVLLEV